MPETLPDFATIWAETDPPSVFLIRSKYTRLGLFSWRNQRVWRLCQVMNCTLRELCATAGLFDQKRIRAYWSNNKWPCFLAVTFSMIETGVVSYKNNGIFAHSD